MSELKELLEKTENITPMGTVNGKKIVSIEEQRDLALLEFRTGSAKLGTIRFNSDGSVAGVDSEYVAVNPDVFYINRYKKVKDALYVVTDYRAIKDQDTGRVYAKMIPAAVIKRDDKGNLVLDKMVTISDAEFVADFTHILNREAMAQIKPLIDTGVGVTSDDLGI